MSRRSLTPRRLLLPAGLLLVLAVGALEIYTRIPVGERTPALGLSASVSTLVLVIHGSADADNPVLAEIVAGLDETFRATPGAAVRYLRWAPEADQRLRAAATAEALGRRLGTGLAALPGLRQIHLIAHSSGSFMPDAICEAYRSAVGPWAGDGPARITMVLLDPFQIRGFVDWRWGERRHGHCADLALAVINTDDPAPATNRPLRQAFNLDVTAHPDRATFDRNGHYWPLKYYRDELLGRQPDLAKLQHRDLARGDIRTVTDRAGLDILR